MEIFREELFETILNNVENYCLCASDYDYIIDNIKVAKDNYIEENTRICDECGTKMDKGYCIGDGDEYYCSDTCLYKNYTEKEYQEMYDNDNAYYTEWED